MNGIIAILLASMFASAKDIMSKKLSFLVHSNVSACTSFIFALPFYIALLFIMQVFGLSPFEYSGNFLLFILLRACTDSAMEFLKMHALSHGEISFISNFFSLTPLFLLFVAPLITGDTISRQGLIGVIVIILGTAVLLQAPKETIPWKGVCFAVCAAFFGSLNICFDRLAVSHAHPVYSGFLMTGISACILLIPMLRIKTYRQEIQNAWTPLVQRGVLEVGFMVIKLYGLRYLEPQYASGLQKITLLFSVALGGKVFNERDRKRRIFASCIICIGSLLLVFTALNVEFV